MRMIVWDYCSGKIACWVGELRTRKEDKVGGCGGGGTGVESGGPLEYKIPKFAFINLCADDRTIAIQHFFQYVFSCQDSIIEYTIFYYLNNIKILKINFQLFRYMYTDTDSFILQRKQI